MTRITKFNADRKCSKLLKLLTISSVLFLILAAGCGDPPDVSALSVDDLVELLGNDDWETREAAQEELERRGDENSGELFRYYRDAEDAEIEWRLGEILFGFGVFLIDNRLIALLTDIAHWKKNLEEQAAFMRQQPLPANWRQQVRTDLDRKFGLIRTAWLAEQNSHVQKYLGDLLQDIGVLADGVLSPPGATTTGQLTAGQVTTGLDDLATKLRRKIDLHGDMDQDGLPTSWELQNGLNPEINDRNADPDNDGKTNQEEFDQQTDPQVPN